MIFFITTGPDLHIYGYFIGINTALIAKRLRYVKNHPYTLVNLHTTFIICIRNVPNIGHFNGLKSDLLIRKTDKCCEFLSFSLHASQK